MSTSKLAKRFRTIGTILIVALLAMVILMFGVTPKIQKGFHEEKVAHVDKREITRAEFLKRKEFLAESSRRQLGEMYGKFIKYLNLEQRSIDSIIDEILIARVFESFSLVAGTEMLRQEVSQLPYFSSGEVTKQSLREYVQILGMTAQAFEQALAQKILTDQLQNTFKDLGRPTTREVEVLNNTKNTKKAFDYIEVTNKSFVDKVKTDDEEALRTYFSENQEKYRKPRAVKFSFVSFPNSDFINSVDVTQEDIAAAYEEKKGNYREPASYRLRKILVRKEATPSPEVKTTSTEAAEKTEPAAPAQTKQQYAESLRARIDKGEVFSKLATEVSEDETTKANGGDIGWMASSSVPAYLKTHVEKLDVGGISPLITTADGYEIVYLDDIKPAREKELAEVTDLVRNELKIENAPVYAEESAQNFLAEVESSKKSLADLAKEKNRPITSLEKPVSIQEPSPGVDPALAKKALEFEEGEKNVVTISGNAYVLETEQIVEALVPELSEIKDAVLADYKQAKSKELAKDYANSLLAKLSSPNPENASDNSQEKSSPETPKSQAESPKGARLSFADWAKTENLEVKNTGLATQTDAAGGPLGTPDSKVKLFQLSMEKPIAQEIFTQGDSSFIVQLSQVEDPKTDKDTAQKVATLRKEERDAAGQRLYTSLIAKLRKQSDVWIDPKLLEKDES